LAGVNLLSWSDGAIARCRCSFLVWPLTHAMATREVVQLDEEALKG
jgi:hypothetical protein